MHYRSMEHLLIEHCIVCNVLQNYSGTLIRNHELKEWKNLCKQLNAALSLAIPRYIGQKDSEHRLLAFTDASKQMFGTVVYIHELESLKCCFLQAKNKIINKQLETKTIPALELHALGHGVEILIDLYQELSGPKNVASLKIRELVLLSDSIVALNWINFYVNRLDKTQKSSVFVVIRLCNISRLCESHPIHFRFIAEENPADLITRAISYKQLIKTNYLTGPKVLQELSGINADSNDLGFQVPNLWANQLKLNANVDIAVYTSASDQVPKEHLTSLDRFSSLYKMIRVQRYVLIYVNLKMRLRRKKSFKLCTH